MTAREGPWRAAGPVLRPASALYGLLMTLRRRAYSSGLRPRTRVAPAVVSIGNLEVGGTGKTPVTAWLARRLVSAGLKVSVVARDLNRRTGGAVEFRPGSGSAGAESDEVLLLASMLPCCRIFTGPSKTAAAVLAASEAAPDVILVDDGFQHLALYRDLDIVVLDFEKPLGTGGVLPGGTLREHPQALSAADCFWVNRVTRGRSTGWLAKVLGSFSRHACMVTSRPVPVALELPGGGSVDPRGLRVVAFCGIARPSSFRDALEEAGCIVEGFHAFPDHHRYTPSDLVGLEAERRSARADLLVTTCKDSVKTGMPGLRLNICALRIELEVAGESDSLVGRIVAQASGRIAGGQHPL